MPAIQPRVQVPDHVAKGEIFEVRTLITHHMETGLRRNDAGQIIPRKIINGFSCTYNGVQVFAVDMHEAMAENPYLSFFLRASESGKLQFAWREDGGATATLETSLTVTG